jgi:hypothetical protein
MCSVRAKLIIPEEMAVWTMVSSESLAWPGQNCPE